MIKRNLIIAIFAFTTLLQADYVMKYNMDGDITEFMYKNASTSKMVTHSDDKVEIYNIKNNSYIVTHSDDGITVVDVNEMRAKAQSMGFDPSAFAPKQEKPKYTIQKTSKKEKVGGITGEVWIIKGEASGKKYETKVVLTNDKRVVKTLRALFDSYSDMSGGMVGSTNFFELKKGYATIKSDGMRLESFKSQAVSSSQYALPKAQESKKKEHRTQVAPSGTLSDEEIKDATDMLKSFF